MNTFCKYCEKEIPENSYFCPNCGKKLKDKEQKISLVRELFIYILCFICAPLGLYWFFKYVRSLDGTKQRVAYMSLIITLIAIIATIGITYSYIQTIKSYMNVPQFKQFSELGL